MSLPSGNAGIQLGAAGDRPGGTARQGGTGDRPDDTGVQLGSARDTLRRWLRRSRFWLIVGGIFVLVMTVVILTQDRGADRTALSPGNPAPDGAMAAAQVLRHQGVHVEVPDRLAGAVALLGQDPQRTTLLLHDPQRRLDAAQLATLRRAGSRIVLIAPSTTVLAAITPQIHSAGVIPTGQNPTGQNPADYPATLAPGCSTSDPIASGRIDRGGLAYRGPVICYPPALTGTDSGSYVQTKDGTVTVLGNQSILSNDRLAKNSNAALVLRTLGRKATLIWYQPSLADIPAAKNLPTPGDLLPGWVPLTVLWLGIVAVLAMVWRGRRDGPLVPEPLPVSVRAAETVEGRARLYQDARAVDRAATSLRAGTLTRLARHFRLGSGTGPQAVIAAAVGQSNRNPAEVANILWQYVPTTEAELVRWAQQLDTLEEEVTSR